MSQNSVTHQSASVVPVVKVASGLSSVTVRTATSNKDRLWVSTNPAVAIYPWLGTSLTAGQSAVIGVSAGQTLYSHSIVPASLTATY